MARQVSVVITGDKEVNRMLHQLAGNEQKKVVRKAARDSIKLLLPLVKKSAPKESGDLRRSLTVRTLERSQKRIGARITTRGGLFQGKTFYGGFQEWGWLLGARRNRKGAKRAKVSVERFLLFGESIELDEHGIKPAERRKIPGKFFMKQRADQYRGRILAQYQSRIKKGVEEIAKKHGAR